MLMCSIAEVKHISHFIYFSLSLLLGISLLELILGDFHNFRLPVRNQRRMSTLVLKPVHLQWMPKDVANRIDVAILMMTTSSPLNF